MPNPIIVIDESQSLNTALTLHFPGTEAVIDGNFNGIKRREYTQAWIRSRVSVEPTGAASFPEGCIKTSKCEYQDGKCVFLTSYFNNEQQVVLEQSFTYVLPSMERIVNKDMRSTDHEVIVGIQEVEPAAGQIWSGPWHRDVMQEVYPITSIVYFAHSNIHSELSFRNSTHASPHASPVETYSFSTYSGGIITFNNQAVEHCVNNVSRVDPSKPSHRFLLTFFYSGPFRVPKSLRPISEVGQVLDLRASPSEEHEVELVNPAKVAGSMFYGTEKSLLPEPGKCASFMSNS